jgi:RimJ/RimL family protein N-acetyltransferase
MKNYHCLTNSIFQQSSFSIVPIRYEDRLDIMKWRNEQMYHLRQNKLLTLEDQEDYFSNVVAKLFDQEQPNQILFSYLKNNKCIGYGGLVHMNWIDKNAEISFVMDTKLEKNYFQLYWNNFLSLIEKVAFRDLCFHKIFTYAFDVRPNLYPALVAAGFSKEAVLENHCFFEGKFRDVIIHSKKNRIELSLATIYDAQLLFDWVNEKEVRRNSLNTEKVIWDDHLKWFNNKLHSQTKIYILLHDKIPAGQIRFDYIDNFWIIDYSIDPEYRGKGLGKRILKLGINNFTKGDVLKAVVKNRNIASFKIFKQLRFQKLIDIDTNVTSFIKKIN